MGTHHDPVSVDRLLASPEVLRTAVAAVERVRWGWWELALSNARRTPRLSTWLLTKAKVTHLSSFEPHDEQTVKVFLLWLRNTLLVGCPHFGHPFGTVTVTVTSGVGSSGST